jgi:hypothetical protein
MAADAAHGLPGLHTHSLQFLSQHGEMEVASDDSDFRQDMSEHDILRLSVFRARDERAQRLSLHRARHAFHQRSGHSAVQSHSSRAEKPAMVASNSVDQSHRRDTKSDWRSSTRDTCHQSNREHRHATCTITVVRRNRWRCL